VTAGVDHSLTPVGGRPLPRTGPAKLKKEAIIESSYLSFFFEKRIQLAFHVSRGVQSSLIIPSFLGTWLHDCTLVQLKYFSPIIFH
jgi:hypothetical protein